MLQRICEEINKNKMLNQKDRVVLGVSGGADSVFLFHAFVKLCEQYGVSFVVVHVNHGIRGLDAQRDADFVKMLCEENKIPFYLFNEDVPAIAKEKGMTEEEAGRLVRYQHFYEVARKEGANKIATAHHQGDQVETILFHLIRGAKLAGMQGMQHVSIIKEENLELIRPLLSFDKEELVEWLQQQGFNWCEDVTNQENQYARNKLRNEVIPLLTQINSQAVSHILEFAQNATIWQEYMQQQITDYWQQNVLVVSDSKGQAAEYVMNREQLREKPEAFVKELLYQVLVALAGKKQDITQVHVDAVCHLLYAQSGKQIDLPYKMLAEVMYEKLRIRINLEYVNEQRTKETLISLEKEEEISYADGTLQSFVVELEQFDLDARKCMLEDLTNSKNIYTKVFDCDTIKNTPCVRIPRQDDYFIMNDDGNRKKLSRFFIDCKIPKDERENMHVVADGNEILWIIGHRRGNSHKVTDQTKRVLVLKWIHEGEKNG